MQVSNPGAGKRVSGDAPGRFVLRPDPRRYRRHAVSAAPLLAISIALVTIRLTDELGWLAAPAVLTLFGLPVALCWAYAWRHRRTVSLALAGRELTLTDWRGRTRTLRRPLAAMYCTIYSGG